MAGPRDDARLAAPSGTGNRMSTPAGAAGAPRSGPWVPLVATLALQTLATMAAYSMPAAAPEVGRGLGVEPALVGVFISFVYPPAQPGLALQTLATMAAYSMPAAAPEVGRGLGVEPALVGVFISFVYGVGMVSALLSPSTIRRFGAARTGQFVMLVHAWRSGKRQPCTRGRECRHSRPRLRGDSARGDASHRASNPARAAQPHPLHPPDRSAARRHPRRSPRAAHGGCLRLADRAPRPGGPGPRPPPRHAGAARALGRRPGTRERPRWPLPARSPSSPRDGPAATAAAAASGDWRGDWRRTGITAPEHRACAQFVYYRQLFLPIWQRNAVLGGEQQVIVFSIDRPRAE